MHPRGSIDEWRLSRRTLLTGTLGVALAFGLGACGGGGGEPNPIVDAQIQVGSPFNAADVRLETLLDPSPVAPRADGGFRATLFADTPNLVYLTTATGEIKAVSILTPAPNETATIDAETTAVALVMLTPGILALSEDSVRNRQLTLRNLASVRALAAHLTTALASGTLEPIVGEAAYSSLLATAVDEAARVFGIATAPPSRDVWLEAWIYNGVSVRHQTWRATRVSRTGTGESGAVTSNQDLGYDLAVPDDWDALFHSQEIPRVLTLRDEPKVRTTKTTRLTYRGYGPGAGTPPSPFVADAKAVDLSAFALVYLPLVFLAASNSALAHLNASTLQGFWSARPSAPSAGELRSKLEAGSDANDALLAVVKEWFPQTSTVLELAPVGWPKGVSVVHAGAHALRLKPLIDRAQMRIATSYWQKLRSYDDVSFPVSGGTIVID